jgi:DNA-binding protein YbaB
MMEREIELLNQLRRDAAELARKLEVAPEKLAGCHGTDPTGTVTVELNGHGLVSKVTVGSGWRTSVGPPHLGQAILAAVAAAGEDRLAAWARAVAENETAGPAATRSPLFAAAAPPQASPSAIQEVFDLLEKVDKEVASGTSGAIALHTAKTSAESPGGHIRVTLTGKQISSIDIDQKWLRLANHQDISTAAHKVIRHAYAAARRNADEVLAGSAAARLQTLMSDPENALRACGIYSE